MSIQLIIHGSTIKNCLKCTVKDLIKSSKVCELSSMENQAISECLLTNKSFLKPKPKIDTPYEIFINYCIKSLNSTFSKIIKECEQQKSINVNLNNQYSKLEKKTKQMEAQIRILSKKYRAEFESNETNRLIEERMKIKISDAYSNDLNISTESKTPIVRSRNRTVMGDYHSLPDPSSYSSSRPSSQLSNLHLTCEENLNLIQEDLKQNLLYPINSELPKSKIPPFTDLRSRLSKTAQFIQLKTAKVLTSKLLKPLPSNSVCLQTDEDQEKVQLMEEMNLKLTSLNSLLQKAELENENLNSKIEQAKGEMKVMSKQNAKTLTSLKEAKQENEETVEANKGLEKRIKELFDKIDMIQAKYEKVCKDILKKEASLKSIIDSKDREIQNKEDIIKEKDSIIKEKEEVVSRLCEKIRKQTVGDFDLQDDDPKDFTFDQLLDSYPIRKRQSEMPNIKNKLIQGRHDDKRYQLKEYEVSLDDNSSDHNDQFGSPNLIKRGSVYNNLK